VDYRQVKELDAHLINKIAAGEVIERPASVAKELIENALDAGSTAIEITVEGGGMTRLCVADNGTGLARADALLAIKRHTTSKIASEADLFKIQTFGFRGEALASIVEVSRTIITTRTEPETEATQLTVEGGNVLAIKSAGRARGTTVDVRELFFNTPARRKFLKSDKTEFFHVLRVIKRFVISHPEVHVRVFHKGKPVLDSPPSPDVRGTIADLYGAELARTLIEISAQRESVRISGLVSPPSLSRSDRSDQFIFVNRRFVRDLSIHYAISKAYETVLKGDQHPVVFLFIEINPEIVDVNVHPKKEEVRFADPISVQAAVKEAITAALTSSHIAPSLQREDSVSLTSPFPQTPPRPSTAAPGAGSWRPPSAAVPTATPSWSPRHHNREIPEKLDLRQEILEAQKAYAQLQTPTLATSEEAFRVIGQLHQTYLIVQTSEGLQIIDQHVAHERIHYENFLDQLAAGRVARQRLLIPLTIELPPDQAELLAQHLQRLDEKLGIGLESFGGGSFILRDWPQVLSDELSKTELKQTIEHLLETLEQEAQPTLEALARRVAAAYACEAAVVKNTPLRPEEMHALVRRLKQTKNPYTCPHGRPIILSYTLAELEKKFGRR
jgi:DNA mismatch repair protein MutL